MIWIGLKKKEMKKVTPIKNPWNDWLINHIPEPTTKSVAGFKDKIVCFFERNTPEKTVYERGKKLRKPKNEKPFISEENKEKN